MGFLKDLYNKIDKKVDAALYNEHNLKTGYVTYDEWGRHDIRGVLIEITADNIEQLKARFLNRNHGEIDKDFINFKAGNFYHEFVYSDDASWMMIPSIIKRDNVYYGGKSLTEGEPVCIDPTDYNDRFPYEKEEIVEDFDR